LTAAAAALDSFPAEDVSLYFSTLLWQDPETWKGLQELPQVRSRLEDASTPRA
jgi:hypothetical protein